jgi:hypothetical protein
MLQKCKYKTIQTEHSRAYHIRPYECLLFDTYVALMYVKNIKKEISLT